MIPYPQIDPVIFEIGPFFGIGPIAPRWYGLMWLSGFLFSHYTLKKHHKWIGLADVEKVDSIIATMVVGIILGARFAYVVFYNLAETLRGPWWECFAVWHGGLAFHGGLAGFVIASVLCARKYRLSWLRIIDVIALSTPVGLGLGRIANFINGELWGRVTDVPWGMVFPGAGPLPRHPSQLYESLFEGLVLYFVLQWVWRKKPNVGVVGTVFLLSYAFIRIMIEFVREPDAQVGFVLGPFTMGQLLSVAMVLFGLGLWRTSATLKIPFDLKVEKKRR